MASEAISEHLISKNFLEEYAPRPPYSCMHMQIKHPCNPPSTNPGYGPAYIMYCENRLVVSLSFLVHCGRRKRGRNKETGCLIHLGVIVPSSQGNHSEWLKQPICFQSTMKSLHCKKKGVVLTHFGYISFIPFST